jgi:hypothetical protein
MLARKGRGVKKMFLKTLLISYGEGREVVLYVGGAAETQCLARGGSTFNSPHPYPSRTLAIADILPAVSLLQVKQSLQH